ncbi:MAG TPA: DUF3570 domain-containing protein [Polyangiaceae bacterium]|jgi:hypothetical protein|nr:DUF3570 domain-containing protein [Polyangiaceae bacterium]
MSSARAPSSFARVVALALAVTSFARAAEPDPVPVPDSEILGRPGAALKLQSIDTRVTAFEQHGYGYQSQAGPLLGPGSEYLTVLEPQVEVVATQGPKLTHRIYVPVDIVTAASPDATDKHRRKVDAISSASRQNYAGSVDWAVTYKADAANDVTMRVGLHVEEPFRSWNGGMSASHTWNDGDTVLAGTLLQVYDWFDHFDIRGFRSGRTARSTSTGSVALTQILTPTTIVNVSYGLTVQRGQLGNTWNVVPLASGKYGPELLPTERVRHALVGRAAQYLPWNGALRLYYRAYLDDWGITAHSVEATLTQRLTPFFYVSALYRFHHQSGADFFTTLAPLEQSLRTADSDLAFLDSHTIGGKLVFDVPLQSEIRVLHFDVGYERYFRTNDLQMNVLTCATGYRF